MQLERRIANLSGEKLALLAKRLQNKQNADQAPIRPVTGRSEYPLAFAQQQIWFIDQLQPGSPVYNVPIALNLRGRLDIAALNASLTMIVRRHQILRARFANRAGLPMQFIGPPEDMSLPLNDLSHLPEMQRATALETALGAEACRPFDLSQGPLLRCQLFRLADDEHCLLLALHHIVTDGWSSVVLARELATCYNALVAGKQPQLAELPFQFTDYALWQREQLSSGQFEAQLNFWLDQLRDVPTVLDLPFDRPRTASTNSAGAAHQFELPPELYRSLQQLARREHCTLFTVLLAAFEVLLYRYSGQDDFCVGTPVANRMPAGCSELIGFFANTLALRARIDVAVSFREYLRSAQSRNQAAFARQDLPFELLVERLQPERDPRISPLFQVMFALEGDPLTVLQLHSLEVGRIDATSNTAKFELVLTIEEGQEQLQGLFEYHSELFAAASIERLARAYQRVLQALVADLDCKLNDLPLLSAQELGAYIETVNATRVARPAVLCVHTLIEAQARQNPQAIAVLSEDNAISYAELNARANRLAHVLNEYQVGPGILVGVCLERSIELIVVLLAVLKTGGAYVPFDPGAPGERLAGLLQDADPALVLCGDREQQRQLQTRLASTGAVVPLVSLAEQSELLAGVPDSDPPVPANDSHIACVIYTSGSTGKPKGVALSHRAVANHNLAVVDLFGLSSADRVLQFNTIVFDAAIEEIFPTLQQGATLVLRPVGPAPAALELLAFVERYQLTLLDLPTAYWHSLVAGMRAARARLPGCVRMVIVGGEAASPTLLNEWWPLVEVGQRWLNTYGPTETTVIASTYEAEYAHNFLPTEAVPIGRPIANTRLYVLDAQQRPLPPGAIGELYIGGYGVAQGYLNQPEQTAAHFLADPFADEPGARMYKSGDLARYLPDGNLVFLGRRDTQIKIRGFRVEPGEIEAVLASHPHVQACAALAREDGRGSRYLCAYLVAGLAVSAADLREYAGRYLPEYMLPVAYVFLEELPMTPTGKIDRRHLPAPGDSDFVRSADHTPPRNQLEQIIADTWTEILGIRQIGLHDDFFELGGHSLLATQVVARIREILQIELSVGDMFSAPTLARLAARAEELRGQALPAQPPLVPVLRKSQMPVAYAQQRLWFLSQMDPDSPLYNIAAALRLCGKLDARLLQAAFQHMVERHESLRTTFTTADGILVQVIAPPQPIELEYIDLSAAPEASLAQELAERAQQYFDLDHGPLLRVSLIRRGAEEHLLMLVCHHTIADGWSTGVLLRELSIAYRALLAGERPKFAPLQIQYADFAVWQREYLQGAYREQLLDYWRRKLAGAAPLLDLPTDRPRPNAQSFAGARHSFTVDAELAAELYRLSRAAGATIFMTLLTAFKILLYRYSNQSDISVGTPIANRSRSALENVIGCFVNTLVLRSDLSGAPSFVDLLRQVRETTLEAYEYQDLPFEMLVDELQPERDLAYAPLFQVMFVLQNTPAQALELGDTEISPLEIELKIAKFDLTLFVTEVDAGFACAFEYNYDLFEPATVERMAGHFQELLKAIVSEPDTSVAQLPILPADELELLLHTWNQTAAEFPSRCVHELIGEQARRSPTAPAASGGDQQLSYAELDTRANQLAHALQQRGAGPDVLIGICMELSLEMLISILAVLKAGAAYVPIDPAYPAERIAFMLADAQPEVLLSSAATARALGLHEHTATRHNIELLCLDQDWPQIALQPASAPNSAAGLDNLAYVIYTSGSTGQPKGTLVSHRGLTNYLWWALRAYPHDGQGAPVHSSLAFDLTITSLYLPLLSGGRVDLLPDEQGIEALARALGERGEYSLVKITPAHLDVLSQQLTPTEAAMATRAFVIGGDNLLVDTLSFWCEHAPQTMLINEYGPTETVVGCCVYQVDGREPGGTAVPIGRPIANTRLYVLDPQRQLVPIGVPGELYIGGVGVARGYLNRPELTAERFLIDPFAGAPGARMYKTGDMVRYRPDGVLEYLGRSDHQVKIRGFRVELGEIEAALSAHAAVQDCVVVTHDDPQRGRRLVAYYVPAALADQPSSAELRDYLRVTLPDYMVPAALVELAQLPLTGNGKVDRKALPAPIFERGAAESGYVAPRNEREAALVEIWRQVLGLGQVGVHDNFFDLGGDSILSIQIVARAVQAGVQLSPRLLFEFPTIAELAARAVAATTTAAEQGALAGNVPLTPIQHWFFEQNFAVPQHWNQALLLEPREPLDLALLGAAFSHLVEQHDALRLRFTHSEAGWQQQYAAPGEQVQVAYVDLAGLATAAAQEALLARAAELQASLDLEHGPLYRLAYFDYGPARAGRLLLIIHHLAIDGVSWRILLEDLEQSYRRLAAGSAPQLPSKSSSYRQWAERLRAYAASAELRADRNYWLALPEQLPAGLPRDFAGGANIEAATAMFSRELDAAETAVLLDQVITTQGMDLNTLLLAALVATASAWSATPALLIDLESHGRADFFDDLDVSRTVGWFTSVYPLRCDTRAGREPAALLQRTQELLRALPRQGLSYGILRYLSADAALRRQLQAKAQAELSFNYLGQLRQQEADGRLFQVTAEPSGPAHATAARRSHVLEFVAYIVDGRLRMDWIYCQNLHHETTIAGLAGRFSEHLAELAAHCHAPAPAAYSPADFSDVALSQDAIEALLNELEPGGNA